MAIIKQGILGGLSGSVGGVVGSSWKGKNVIKSKPVSVANPQTAGQVEQRTRMSACVAFAQLILSIWIKPLFDRFAQGLSGFNAFVSRNIGLFVAGVLDEPTSLVMSIGNMSSTAIDGVVADRSEDTIVVNWIPDTDGFHLASDVAYLLAYNEIFGEVASSSVAIRSEGTGTIVMPANWEAGHVLQVWLAFKRTNGIYVSLASVTEEAIVV